jgi:uncharacterized membrane protein YadS
MDGTINAPKTYSVASLISPEQSRSSRRSNSTAVFAPPVMDGLQHASVFLIAVALAGIGLSRSPRVIASADWRPLALGAILWVLVASTALAMMWVTGALG